MRKNFGKDNLNKLVSAYGAGGTDKESCENILGVDTYKRIANRAGGIIDFGSIKDYSDYTKFKTSKFTCIGLGYSNETGQLNQMEIEEQP